MRLLGPINNQSAVGQVNSNPRLFGIVRHTYYLAFSLVLIIDCVGRSDRVACCLASGKRTAQGPARAT